MPAFPSATILPTSNVDPDPKKERVYSGFHRMAIAPHQAFDFTQGDFTPYNQIMNSLTEVNQEKALASEVHYKKLYLTMLDHMGRRESFDYNAAGMFTAFPKKRVLGSQSLLLRAKFSEKEGFEQFLGISIPNNESTTPYHFFFSFINDDMKEDNIKFGMTAPVFLADDKLLTLMEEKEVPPKKIQKFFNGFMKMAALAEHDYIHAITLPYQESLPYSFLADDDVRFYGTLLEKHALMLHATVLKETFQENPKRKRHVISYAEEAFSDIADIRQSLLAEANDEDAIIQANMVATYLAEIYWHRLFRVLSPDDPDLNVSVRKGKKSANDLMNEIPVIVPMDRVDEKSGYYEGITNKEKLLLNLSTVYVGQSMLNPGVYRDIHDATTLDVTYTQEVYRQVPYSLLEILNDHYNAACGMDKEALYAKKNPKPVLEM